MQTVTFYSYKGGVGRSLTVANFAAYLAQLGIHSIVMDLDLEAPGQHFKFGTATEPLPVETGVVDILWSLVENQTIDAELVKKSLIKIDLGDATGSVHLLPAGSAPSLHYQQRLRQLDMRSLLGDSDLGGLGLLELREVLNELVTEQIDEEPHFLFIDSRTGITDLGKFACAFLADHLVAMFLNQPEHLQGTRAFLRSAISGPRLGEPLNILPVVSRAPDDSIESRSTSIAGYLSEPADVLTSTLSFTANHISTIRHESKLVKSESLVLKDTTNWASGYQSDLIDLFHTIAESGSVDLQIDRPVTKALAPANLNTILALAASLYDAEDYASAARRYKDILSARFQTLGPLHESTISAEETLAATLYAALDLPGATTHQESVIRKSIEVFGGSHARTLKARANLAAMLYSAGRYREAREEQAVVVAEMSVSGPGVEDATKTLLKYMHAKVKSLGLEASTSAIDSGPQEVLPAQDNFSPDAQKLTGDR